MKYVIGVDFGGTNIKLGLVNPKGKIIRRARIDTRSYFSSKAKLINSLAQKIREVMIAQELCATNISGIGIGLPGLIDPRKGIVRFLPNVPGWRNVPLVKILERSLNIATFIDNDVNLAALGEWQYGAGKGADSLICVTLGTGVGGGIILDGKLYRGEGYVAGEIGHIPINEKGPACNCGGSGCLERYVGNQSLLKKARRCLQNKDITLEEVYALANQSNSKALALWEETAVHIGNALVGVVNVLNPRLIIIGGGVAKAYKHLKKPLIQTIKNRSMQVQSRMVAVRRARLGDDAGILGAQILMKDLTTGAHTKHV